MLDQGQNTLAEITKFVRGENKPTMIFEFSYANMIFLIVGIIFAVVISQLIINALK